MGIREQLGAIRSHEVPNASFIRMNPNLTPIAKRRNKKQDTYFLQADLGALSCCLLSAMSRFDSLPNKTGRACRICQSQANPPIICLSRDGNRKVLVIRRLTIFLSGALKIIPHNPEGLTQAASMMWLSITYCRATLPPGLLAASGAKSVTGPCSYQETGQTSGVLNTSWDRELISHKHGRWYCTLHMPKPGAS